MKVNYTIIIPYFNSPYLLKRCLKSIPLKNDLQIIVVDDCSPISEAYSEIVSDYSKLGVEFYQTDKNSGAGCARNIGLKQAKGKWLIFSDSDDYFNPCFEDMLNNYVDSDYDVVYFNASSQDSETCINTKRSCYINSWIDGYLEEPLSFDYHLRYLFGEPWGKMINHNLVQEHDIKFEETIIHNDTQFSYQVGFYANKIFADKHAIYCITDRENSVSKTVSVERLLTRTKVFCKKYEWLTTRGIPYKLEELAASGLNSFRKNMDTVNYNKCLDIFKSFNINLKQINWYFAQYYKKPSSFYIMNIAFKNWLLKWVNRI